MSLKKEDISDWHRSIPQPSTAFLAAVPFSLTRAVRPGRAQTGPIDGNAWASCNGSLRRCATLPPLKEAMDLPGTAMLVGGRVMILALGDGENLNVTNVSPSPPPPRLGPFSLAL